MKSKFFLKRAALGTLALAVAAGALWAQQEPTTKLPDRPDPNEIPLPAIKTAMPALPGVDKLPNRPELPDVMTLNNGHNVKTVKQWEKRRVEMKKILEYYEVGQAPPPPGNVIGQELSSQLVNDGKVKYRLVHLVFGPQRSLSLNIGIFTPVTGGPFPVVIYPSQSPPGATALPRLAQGANQGSGKDALLVTGPAAERTSSPANAAMRARFGPKTAEQIATTNPALAHGYALVVFDNDDCAEDTTLRNADGSWAYRTTRFFPAYPGYDWGILRAWAWGASRIVDYLITDPSINKNAIIMTGVSRNGKGALIAGSFDDRISMVAPVASSGGGTPAFRFSGSIPDRGGKEGLTEMVAKYPNWFSDHLHQFWGQPDKLPFDEHWLIALCAPRPFISLEGDHDQNVNQNGVYQSIHAAKPAYEFLHVGDKLGVSWADRPHGMVQGDWDALLAFGDKFLLGKPVTRSFDQYPAGFTPGLHSAGPGLSPGTK
jgi:Abhydrolase family